MFDAGLKVRNALGIHATSNSLFGLWPLEKDNVFLKIRWYLSTLSLTVQVLLAMYETNLSCNQAKSGFDNLVVITFGFMGLSKMIFYYKHRDKLRLSVESAIEDWSSESSSEFSVVMENCRLCYNKIINSYLAGSLIAAIGYPCKIFLIDSDSIIKMTKSEYNYNGNVTILPGKRYLFPAACSLSNVSEYFYWAIIFSQFIQFIISVGVNLSCDVFFITIAHHLVGQYTILKEQFAAFKDHKIKTETRAKFGILVVRHCQLMKLSMLLEASFNMLILTHMIMNIALINVAGFNLLLLLNRGELLGALTNASLVHFAVVQTFMYSYIGGELNSHGVDIALSVYDSTWHTMSKNWKKDLVFVMTRASFSFHLTAGKLFKMTRGTFTDIIKTAFSYLSVLRIVINDRNL